MHIENVIIGKSLVEPKLLFASDDKDWDQIERLQTMYTEERYLPRILVEIGFTPSTSELKRNRKDLCVKLNKPDFIHISLKKGKKQCWIAVGE